MKILTLVGLPATGKSTIVKEIVHKVEANSWQIKKYRKLRFMISGRLRLIVFGMYPNDPTVTFCGTDMLSMDIINDSTSFLRKCSVKYPDFNVLIEGDRFNNQKFLGHLRDKKYDTSIMVIECSDEHHEMRQFARGNKQSPIFIKRCKTKIANLKQNFSTEVFSNNDDEDFALIMEQIRERLSIGAATVAKKNVKLRKRKVVCRTPDKNQTT